VAVAGVALAGSPVTHLRGWEVRHAASVHGSVARRARDAGPTADAGGGRGLLAPHRVPARARA